MLRLPSVKIKLPFDSVQINDTGISVIKNDKEYFGTKDYSGEENGREELLVQRTVNSDIISGLRAPDFREMFRGFLKMGYFLDALTSSKDIRGFRWLWHGRVRLCFFANFFFSYTEGFC